MNELMIKKFRESCDYNIVLIGFMGAGKSTVARTLGEWFDMEIVEMDELISDRQRMSIPEIFEKHGEEYFRNLETNLLIELQKTSRTIISCGGGAAMRSQNVSEMKKNGYVVLLTATPKTILERVKENDDRPLLKNHKNVEYIAELMEKRREKYETAADLIVQTDEKNVQEICKEMITKLPHRRTAPSGHPPSGQRAAPPPGQSPRAEKKNIRLPVRWSLRQSSFRCL